VVSVTAEAGDAMIFDQTPSGELTIVQTGTGSTAQIETTIDGKVFSAQLDVGETITYTVSPAGSVTTAGQGGDIELEIDGAPVVLTDGQSLSSVPLDVKPDGDANSINLNSISDAKNKPSNATVPVVLFTTAEFDAAAVNVGTVFWAGAGVHHSALEDVDGDGDLDLVMYFRLHETNLLDVFRDLADPDGDRNKQSFTVTTTLTGETTDGADIVGTDAIDLVMTGKPLRDLLDSL
jgi:hypothetical protein